jgi:CubicO group peptidase (beta-lactamase class C family)
MKDTNPLSQDVSSETSPQSVLSLDACRRVALELCARQRPPGLSVGVVSASPGVWSEGFGLADIETRRPAARDTVYPWFSMTKLMTATAVVQLAERGKLALDDPVRRFVSDFPSGNRGDRVTVRHLLSHSAGLANPIPVGWVRPAEKPARELDEFTGRLLAKHSRLRFGSGRDLRPPGGSVLGVGFLVEGAPYGGLIGTAPDAARFLRLHLGATEEPYPSVLSRAGVVAMQQLTARGRKLDVALGWFHRRADPSDGKRYWEHLGGGGAFFSSMRVYPELNFGFVAMGNSTSWNHIQLGQAVAGSRSPTLTSSLGN